MEINDTYMININLFNFYHIIKLIIIFVYITIQILKSNFIFIYLKNISMHLIVHPISFQDFSNLIILTKLKFTISLSIVI
jgi:hypothetical protein